MHNIIGVQCDVWLAQCSALSRVERRIPLFVFVAESYDGDITFLDEVANTHAVNFGRLVVSPESRFLFAKHIASGVASFMIGNGRGKIDIKIVGLCTGNNLIAPVSVDFSGQVDGPTHIHHLKELAH
jgi:hypothetical protein